MYTFIKRTVPPPAMLVFDASNRDQCEVKRLNTNTPLQALVLMNDPQVLEASRGRRSSLPMPAGSGQAVCIAAESTGGLLVVDFGVDHAAAGGGDALVAAEVAAAVGISDPVNGQRGADHGTGESSGEGSSAHIEVVRGGGD